MRDKLYIVLLIQCTLFWQSIQGSGPLEYQDEFTTWMAKNKKSYEQDEFSYRFEVFKKNMEFIQTYNAKRTGVVLAMNAFGDLTDEEFQQFYIRHTPIVFNNTASISSNTPSKRQYPAAWDWTPTAVTNVKTQGPCESSWAFATAGAVEGCHEISGNGLLSLSAQNLMDCSWKDGNQGCNGGVVTQALDYIIGNAGIDSSASYPYRGENEACDFRRRFVGATITGYNSVSPSQDEAALQAAVYVGPTAVTIDANHASFRFYSGGVYYEPACSPTAMNHAALAVGWSATSSGTEYWIVKNSWGVNWGINGYILMSRNANNNCGIATLATIPTC